MPVSLSFNAVSHVSDWYMCGVCDVVLRVSVLCSDWRGDLCLWCGNNWWVTIGW